MKLFEFHKGGHRRGYLSEIVVVLTLVGYQAIAPISLLLDVPNRFISIPLRATILGLALFIIFKRLFIKKNMPSGLMWFFLSLFWGLYFGRMILDSIFSPEVLRLSLGEYILSGIGICFLPALAIAISPPKAIWFLLRWVLIIGFFAVIFNLLLIQKQGSVDDLMSLLVKRQATETLSTISLGDLGVMVVLLGIWAIFQQSYSHFLKKIYFACTIMVGLMAAIIAGSRGPVLSLLVLLPLLAYELFRNQRMTFDYLIKLIWSIVLVLPAVSYLLIHIHEFEGFNRIQSGLFSDDIRVRLLQLGLDSFYSHPLLGSGIEPLGFYPHNVILESFMLYGVISGFLFVGLLGYATYCAFWRYLYTPESAWISILFFQAVIISMVSGSLYGSASMWSLMVLVVVANKGSMESIDVG
ncbi:O-antigen ligase family protein [Pelodictyon luteolum]|nr:O-antigen ligase family protein [Pelodictyon luteolum]